MPREVVRLHAAQAAFRKSAALYRGFVGGISSLGARALRPRTSKPPHAVSLRERLRMLRRLGVACSLRRSVKAHLRRLRRLHIFQWFG